MDEKNENIASPAGIPQPPRPELPFDDTTNFSILGWLLEKLGHGKSSKEVDFKLEE
jgi:hypothetical protein